MTYPRPRLTRTLASWAFALVTVVSFFAWRHQTAAPPPDESMVFSMSIRDGSGDVLASPVVMGEPGQKVQVRMLCEQDPDQEKMHLTLDPIGTEGGQMLYSYELSVPGQMETQHGTVKLSMGRERRIRLHSAGSRGVTLSLYTESLKQYMQRRKMLTGRVES